VHLSLYLDQFYARQYSFVHRVAERLKMAVTVLRGREYLFEDMVLDEEASTQVLDFFLALRDGAEEED
jgi:hypothetical protein